MKRSKLLLITLAAVSGFAPLAVMAQQSATVVINPNLPYVSNPSNIGSLIEGFYLFALSLAGIMAFGAIVYGGIRYAAGRGNPSAESTGKSWITNALLGLLLLGGAYVILQTVNPALTTLGIPGLPHLNSATVLGFNASSSATTSYGLCVYPTGKPAFFVNSYPTAIDCTNAAATYGTNNAQENCIPGATSSADCTSLSNISTYSCIPTSGGEGKYNGPGIAGYSSSWSPGLKAVMGCLQTALSGVGTVGYTTNGQHTCKPDATPPSVSCHFGGTGCKDGGHALDIDVSPTNDLQKLQQAKKIAESCGASTQQQIYCRCESQNGASLDPSCTSSTSNHVHCNVDNVSQSCGCN